MENRMPPDKDSTGAVTRRSFMTRACHAALAAAAARAILPVFENRAFAQTSPTLPAQNPAEASQCDLAVMKAGDPAAACRSAVEALGGMKRFVKKGDVVVVKPNIGWDAPPEFAANTNPLVVRELVSLAFAAGAAKVKVFDHTCNNPRSSYVHSGIEPAAAEAGATVIHFEESRCRKLTVPNGQFIKEWPVFIDAVENDCLINVPVAKVHGLCRVSLGMKNLMGVIGGNRGQWHKNINQALAEFLGALKPRLTIIDAFRLLAANGPTGGSVEHVRTPQICIASTDIVAADSRAAALFGFKPEDLGFVVKAASMDYGQMDTSKLRTTTNL